MAVAEVAIRRPRRRGARAGQVLRRGRGRAGHRLRGRRRRDLRLPRPERRGQVDHDQHALHARAADRRLGARVAGHDVVRERDEVRRNIGLVFQDTTLDGYLSAEQNLRLHAELYGVPRELVARADASRCSRWSACGSGARASCNTFSGGMKRRLEIARGLLHSPRVLFLDEPTVGLDPQTRRSIWGYIRELKRARGHHDLPDHALHGRGRVLRPDRDHGQRPDRRARHARGAEGERRQGPRADRHRRRRRRRSPRCASASGSRRRSPRARSRSGVPGGRAVRAAAVRRARRADPRRCSVSRPSLDDVFMSYTGTTIRDAEASGDRPR